MDYGTVFTKVPKLLSVNYLQQLVPIINTKNAKAAVEYSDAYLHDNDARFVFNFVRSSMDNNCIAVNYVESIDAVNLKDYWLVTVKECNK